MSASESAFGGTRPEGPRRQGAIRALAALTIAALGAMACSVGSGTTAPAATATATLTPLGLCQAAVPGSAAAITGGAGFANVPFQPNASALLTATVGGGVGQFTVKTYKACAPGVTVADVNAFYAAQMTANGWASAAEFPTDGQLHQACAGACWMRDAKTRKATVSGAHLEASGVTTYQLAVASPPPIPDAACRANEYSPSTPTEYTTNFGDDIPLPPLSTLTLGEGQPDGPVFAQYCSAGNVTSVKAFFNAYLPGKGWALGSLPAAAAPGCATGGTASGWVKGGNKVLQLTIPSTTTAYANGFKWALRLCAP